MNAKMEKIRVFVSYNDQVHEYTHELVKDLAPARYIDMELMGKGLLFPDWCGWDVTVMIFDPENDLIYTQRGKWYSELIDYLKKNYNLQEENSEIWIES